VEKIDVSLPLIKSIAREVTPLVERLTQWNLATENLGLRVIPKDRGYEEVLLGRLKGLGIPFQEDGPRPILERLIEYVLESNILAAYQPNTQELLIIRENVDESNLDGLKLVVGHELVHRGQHMQHPQLFFRLDEILKEVLVSFTSGKADVKNLIPKMEEIRPIMTLIESHARFIQEQLKQTNFPNAKIETHFNLATLLMRLFGKQKISQYTEGIADVASASRKGEVDSLFKRL
jgi:hypothetical protein